MNLTRKLEIAKLAVTSISRHDDETVENVGATLDELNTFIAKEHNDFVARKSGAE